MTNTDPFAAWIVAHQTRTRCPSLVPRRSKHCFAPPLHPLDLGMHVQGHLADKKEPPPLGPPYDPRYSSTVGPRRGILLMGNLSPSTQRTLPQPRPSPVETLLRTPRATNRTLECRNTRWYRFSISERLLHINVQRLRGRLVSKARRLCSSLNSRLESKKDEEDTRWCRVRQLEFESGPLIGRSTCHATSGRWD